MKICQECDRNHYGTGNYCSTCYKKRRDAGMPARTEREYGQGKPNGVLLLPLTEIHYMCICTWVWDYIAKLHRLKYMNYNCPARFWHNSLGMAPDHPRMPLDNGQGKVQAKPQNGLAS